MTSTISTLALLITWLAVCGQGFPVLDQPIYEAPGLPKVDVYYQGGVTSHFDKQLAPLPFVSGSKNSFKKSGDDFRVITSNEIQTGYDNGRSAGKQGMTFEKSPRQWTETGVESKPLPRETPRAFESWVVFDGDFQES